MGDACLHESVLDAADRIRRLEVQGARNVAITAVAAIEGAAKESKAWPWIRHPCHHPTTPCLLDHLH